MIAVVLPFRNAAATLPAAIRSVLAQSLPPASIVLINNGSTDGSTQIAESFAGQHPHIRLLHEPRPGVAHAMNTALLSVSHPWVARMDADDEWYPNKLEQQWDYLRLHSQARVLATQVRHLPHMPAAQGLAAYVQWSNSLVTPGQIDASIFVESPLVNPSVVFSLSLIHKYGPYLSGQVPEDYEMFLRWHHHGVALHKLPQVLMDWHDYPGRLTRTHPDYSVQAFNQVKCQYLAQYLARHNPFHPGVWIWGAGRRTRQRAQILASHGVHILGYIDIAHRSIPAYPCIHYSQLAQHLGQGIYIVSFVANRGAGHRIGEYLLAQGYVPQSQFVMAS